MLLKRILVPAFVILSMGYSVAQDSYDSLMYKLNKAANDTEKVSLLSSHTFNWLGQNIDSAGFYARMQYDLVEKSENDYLLALAVSMNGIVCEYKGDNQQALQNHIKAFRLMKKTGNYNGMMGVMNALAIILSIQGYYQNSIDIHEVILQMAEVEADTIQMAHSCLNMGLDYHTMGLYHKAIQHSLKALSIYERLEYQTGIADACNNIGMIYESQRDNDKALEYYYRCRAIEESVGNEFNLAGIYNNIGLIYYSRSEFDSCVSHFSKANEIWTRHGYTNGTLQVMGNLGLAYLGKKEFGKALELFEKDLELMDESGNKGDLIYGYKNLGRFYHETGDQKKSVYYFLLSLELSRELDLPEQAAEASRSLSQTYFAMGDYKNAYLYRDKAASLNDSINRDNAWRTVTQMETNFILEKRNQQYKLESVKKEAVHREEMNRSRYTRNTLIVGVVLALLLTGVAYRSYRMKRRMNIRLEEKNTAIMQQKEEIASQRDEIEAQRDQAVVQRDLITAQKKDLTDSIRYASRIQRAILPKVSELNQILKDYFLLYMPRDVVSGDFYWYHQKGSSLYLAVADCTGHGVPGAFMSVMGVNLLNDVVKHKSGLTAAGLLDEMRHKLIESTHSRADDGNPHSENIRDGMDMSLCIIDTESKMMNYAGANNSALVVRSEAQEETVLQFEIDADRMPLGQYPRMTAFNDRYFQLRKNDMLYLFSDGFADQFGGNDGKKYKAKQLKDLFSSLSTLKPGDQYTAIVSAYEKWKGSREQVDDITILGLRIQ
jgi:serine phosphatase RsbU (regulator of sigma subunit)